MTITDSQRRTVVDCEGILRLEDLIASVCHLSKQ